jgi:Cu/Zn superoxide dismutase
MGGATTGSALRSWTEFRRRACAAILVAAAVAGCQSMYERQAQGGLVAQLRGTGSAVTGAVYIFDARDGVQVQVSVSNLLPGTYRIALHQGNCKSPNFFSAGPAWAPPGSSKPPGELLPSFVANMDMNMNNYVAFVSGLRIDGPGSLRGRSVVLHYGEQVTDAFPGQPNNRMACGVLEATESVF